jgi:hypothetical protein
MVTFRAYLTGFRGPRPGGSGTSTSVGSGTSTSVGSGTSTSAARATSDPARGSAHEPARRCSQLGATRNASARNAATPTRGRSAAERKQTNRGTHSGWYLALAR